MNTSKPIYHDTHSLFGDKVELWQCPKCGENVAQTTNGKPAYRDLTCINCKTPIDYSGH